jgi:hypothetical protein
MQQENRSKPYCCIFSQYWKATPFHQPPERRFSKKQGSDLPDLATPFFGLGDFVFWK